MLSEEEHRVKSRIPMDAISAMTWGSTRSPLRRWWWKEMGIPSFSPTRSMAARRLGISLPAEDVWPVMYLLRRLPGSK